MTLQSSLDALESDAVRWDTTSHTLADAGTAAQGLALGTSQLSWAADETGLTATYEQIRAKVAGLLTEGGEQTGAIATRLRQVKRDYEGTDEAARARLAGSWDVAP